MNNNDGPEMILQKQIVRELREWGLEVIFVPNEYAGSLDGSSGIYSGCPDLIVLSKDGRVLFLEVKTEDGQLQDNQKTAHGNLARRKFQVTVVRSVRHALWECRWFLTDKERIKMEGEEEETRIRRHLDGLSGGRPIGPRGPAGPIGPLGLGGLGY